MSTITIPPELRARSAIDRARADVHDHELALHDARSSGVDAWVAAANDSLHEALIRLAAAEAQQVWFADATPPNTDFDIYSELCELMGSLNMLALRGVFVEEKDDTLCLQVGRSHDLRLALTRNLAAGRAPYTVRLYRVTTNGRHITHLGAAPADRDTLVDVVWDTVDGYI